MDENVTTAATAELSATDAPNAEPTTESPAGVEPAAPNAAAEPTTQDLTQETTADPDAAPLTAWNADTVTTPDGVDVDADLLAGFGEAAVAAGLSRKQAQALVDWQVKYAQAQAQAQLDAGVETLKKAWGAKAEGNQRAVLSLISRIDRLTGDDSFSRALGESGATCFPGVVRGLHRISQMLSEDSIGNATGTASQREETALEGLQNAFNESSRRK